MNRRPSNFETSRGPSGTLGPMASHSKGDKLSTLLAAAATSGDEGTDRAYFVFPQKAVREDRQKIQGCENI